ncbi:peptidoglycan-binding protein [Streptomyces sp. NPDC057748]|uniref:peptidoglycan-binding domain-containing protein n=1 Tax=unclassified Streptomyces TaxID=2593676 RepID=UPI003695A977
MATTRTSHRAAPARRPAGALRRLLRRLRRHPLAIGVAVVAVLTLTASAYQNAHGRARSTPPPAIAPASDECAATTCPAPSEDTGGEAEDTESAGDTEADTPPAQTPAHRPGTAARTWPLVKSGAEGETVAAIQLLLTAHGYRTDVDAEFGPATTAHVTSYQRDRSLADDGIVGPDTWHALIVNARDGDKGPAVQALQRLLTAHSHPVSMDGVFGQETTQAVTAFQTEHQLTSDGIVGPDTWSTLISL